MVTATVEAILAHPDWLDQEASERSLHEFVRQYWQFVEPPSQPFVDNWHIGAICEYLQAVYDGEIRRLLILVPPRTSKSTITSVMFPAWYWTRDAGQSFLSASYAQSLSRRDSRKCRSVIQSALYRGRYPDIHLIGDQNTQDRYENNHHGYRLATSVGGALTGEGANVIIIDDPLNAEDANSETKRAAMTRWFDESMTTRLNDPQTGAFVAIMQRLHEGDFAGHVMNSGDWDVLCLPMRYESDHPQASPRDERTQDGELLFPERFPEAELEVTERNLGSYATAGQMQQRPSPRKGGMFDPDWWEIVDAAPAGGRDIRRWDLAASPTGDYTVGLHMRRVGAMYYVLDVVRLRGTDLQAERAVVNTAKQDGRGVQVHIPIDPGQAGLAQRRHYAALLAGFDVRFAPEVGSKRARAEGTTIDQTSVSAQAEAGNVKLVKGAWNKAFIDECSIFPNGDYDDQVDTLSGAFNVLVGAQPRTIAAPQAVAVRG